MTRPFKVAIVWRDSWERRGKPLPDSSRLIAVLRALETKGLTVEPLAYCEEASREFRRALLGCDGALIWVDPLAEGRNRADLDAVLRQAAAAGVWLSAHPDVIAKMGTKEVLFATRDLGWGGDTALYRSVAEFRRDFPERLKRAGTRVLKQYRGNGGQGVWRVTLNGESSVRLQEATHRDGTALETPLADFLERCEGYFAGPGGLIDQAFQPRIVEGMIRCYMSGETLVGFARQYPAADGIAAERIFGLPAAKTMFAPSEPQFQTLRAKLEQDWTPQMCRLLGLEATDLPALWDADFLFGPKSASGEDSFVLCEINASCVTPFPVEAPAAIACVVQTRLTGR